jgi:hypothetical protein
MADDLVYACPSCLTPLARTTAFLGLDLYCLDCGSAFPARTLEPAGDVDPELQDAVQEEWQELGSGLLSGGEVYLSCAVCRARNESHVMHAAEGELAASRAAEERLRARRTFG